MRPPNRRHVVLWGPPAVGKTTIGRALAARIELPFVDLDDAIRERSGSQIEALFAAGEERFREVEAAVLRDLFAEPSAHVIAVGGGALVDTALRVEALRVCLVIGLRATLPSLIHRAGNGGPRPLLSGNVESRLKELVAVRSAAYRQVHLTIETEALAPPAIAEAIANRLEEGVVPLWIEPDASYSVRIASNAAARDVAEVLSSSDVSSVFLVTDENVGRLHAPGFVSELDRNGVKVASVTTIPVGEEKKAWSSVERILSELAGGRADRASVVVALGGGVVTDIAGFAASVYARGIRWAAVPTTTLAMVDAAIGGKTGINFGHAKNLVGTFHHPIAVVVDPSFTRTQSDRDVMSGLGELVKVAAVTDERAFAWLESRANELAARDPGTLNVALSTAASLKAAIVELDPREGSRRMILNFGHTLGHAIESATDFMEYSHGEAVSIGMVAAHRIGESLGVSDAASGRRLRALLEALRLPTTAATDTLGRAIAYLVHDKKRAGNLLRFVLLERVGRATIVPVEEDTVRVLLTADV